MASFYGWDFTDSTQITKCVFDKKHIDMSKTCLRYMKETKNIVTSN